MTAPTDATPAGALDRPFPPLAPLIMASLALVLLGGIDMAAKFPRRPPLALPVALLASSAVLAVAAVVLMTRVHDFAWDRFRLVFGWALLAYIVQAGMIEYAFVENHVSGSPLVVVTLMLVMFALDVPFVIASTAARYA